MSGPYRELVVKGDDKILRGFLAGYRAVRRVSSGMFMCQHLPIETGHLKELLRGKFSWEHLIVNTTHHKALVAALKSVRDDLKLEIISDRKVRRASFVFEFETFNRKVAGELKRLYRRPPAGVRITVNDVHEDENPEAHGVELYSPAHEYSLKGSATASGDIEALLKLHAKYKYHEFVDVEDIVIKH